VTSSPDAEAGRCIGRSARRVGVRRGAASAGSRRARGDDAAGREPAAQQGTSRLGQVTMAALSGSSAPGTPARCTRHKPSSPSRVSATSWPPASTTRRNLRAAPQVSSSDSASPCQCSHAPTACGSPSAPGSVKTAPQPGPGPRAAGSGSSGSAARHRSPISSSRAEPGPVCRPATGRYWAPAPMMTARLSRAALVSGSAGASMRSPRATVSVSRAPASVSRPTA
jgi:hypothetical protein